MADFCGVCGAHWACEHQEPESVGMESITVTEARAMVARHLEQRPPSRWDFDEGVMASSTPGYQAVVAASGGSGLLDTAGIWRVSMSSFLPLYDASALEDFSDVWASLETTIRQNIDAFETDRRAERGLSPVGVTPNRTQRRRARYRPEAKLKSYQPDIARWRLTR